MEKTLHDQLVEIQQKLKAPKNQTNSFGGYKYRSCEDILEAVKPLLKNCSILLSDEVVNVGTKNYVKAIAMFTNGKDQIIATAYAREAEDKKGMDDAQITGSASSYARKYALNGLFAIDDTKDADTMDNTEKPQKTTVEDRATAQTEHFCKLHGKELKRRSTSGGISYDHRLLIDDVWNTCYGKGWEPQKPYVKEEIPEVDVKDYEKDYEEVD